jgi:hypothetical protein
MISRGVWEGGGEGGGGARRAALGDGIQGGQAGVGGGGRLVDVPRTLFTLACGGTWWYVGAQCTPHRYQCRTILLR